MSTFIEIIQTGLLFLILTNLRAHGRSFLKWASHDIKRGGR
jgi:hypothetical protein